MVVISIAQGKLKGGETKTDNGVAYYEFLGIPYAKPPIGNLRFRVSKYIIYTIRLHPKQLGTTSNCFEYI